MSNDRTVVRCKACGAQQDVSIAECLMNGWPKCCESTMTLNATEPQKFGLAMDKVMAPAAHVLKKARGE